jgi:hypothetical protein
MQHGGHVPGYSTRWFHQSVRTAAKLWKRRNHLFYDAREGGVACGRWLGWCGSGSDRICFSPCGSAVVSAPSAAVAAACPSGKLSTSVSPHMPATSRVCSAAAGSLCHEREASEREREREAERSCVAAAGGVTHPGHASEPPAVSVCQRCARDAMMRQSIPRSGIQLEWHHLLASVGSVDGEGSFQPPPV